MARNDQDTYAAYQRDEFDNPPAGPVGAHRGKTSLLSRVLPYLIVVVAAALVGALVWGVYSGEASHIRFPWSSQTSSSAVPAPSKTASTVPSQESSDSASASQSASASPSESSQPSASASSPSPEQTVNKATAIIVTNATRISGHAAQQAGLLTQQGYTSVTSRNATGQIPSDTVVMYQNETDKATAQDVANTLGIGAVQQVQDISGPIVVVLVR